MQKKALIETNPYLRGTDKARKALITNVSSNTSIETGRSAEAIARDLSRSRSPVKTPRGSGR